MKKILFPTEFSENAPVFFRYAAELSCFFKAKLVMMHAFNQPEVRLYPKEDLEKMAAESNGKLMDFVDNNLPEHCKDIEVEYVVRSGLASTEILKVALEEEVDLLVLGKTGKTNALEAIFGSTSLEILSKADCPLLLIPASAKFEGIDNILFTTDFDFTDLYGINLLKNWGRVFDATVRVVNVIENEKYGMEALKNMSILKNTYKHSSMLEFDLIAGDFEEQVEKYAKKKRVDIIAMISHKRNFLSRIIEGSTSRQLAKNIKFPFLVIKENPYESDGYSSDWIALVNSFA